MIFLRVLLCVYALAINFYAFMLLYIQKTKNDVERVTDGKILLAGALGGALGVYLSTFFLKYRRTSLFIMAVMPLLATLNLYLFISGFYMRFIF